MGGKVIDEIAENNKMDSWELRALGHVIVYMLVPFLTEV